MSARKVKYTGIRVDNGEIVEGYAALFFKEAQKCYIAPAGTKIAASLDKKGNIIEMDECFFCEVHPDMVEFVVVDDENPEKEAGADT